MSCKQTLFQLFSGTLKLLTDSIVTGVKINEKKIASKEEYERKLYENYKHTSKSRFNVNKEPCN